jgi:hypothetical protein
MNVLLWIVQVSLALHTGMGAMWKFARSPDTVPSLQAIPPGLWRALSVVELLCAVALVLPAFSKRLAALAPVAAAFVTAEMLLFSGVHLHSGSARHGEMVYWLVVAAVSAFVAYGRFRLVRSRAHSTEAAAA